jgi:hypothetical protein
MIDKEITHSLEWIKKFSASNQGADKILVEKTIRALTLLEGLAKSNLNFIFKGGTALMLGHHPNFGEIRHEKCLTNCFSNNYG